MHIDSKTHKWRVLTKKKPPMKPSNDKVVRVILKARESWNYGDFSSLGNNSSTANDNTSEKKWQKQRKRSLKRTFPFHFQEGIDTIHNLSDDKLDEQLASNQTLNGSERKQITYRSTRTKVSIPKLSSVSVNNSISPHGSQPNPTAQLWSVQATLHFLPCIAD